MKRTIATPVRLKLVRTLHKYGSVTCRSGRATTKLAQLMQHESTGLANVLRMAEADGIIIREMNSRRCFSISLAEQLPEPFSEIINDDSPVEVVEFEPKPEPQTEFDYAELATQLLHAAAEAISGDKTSLERTLKSKEEALTDARQKLHEAHELNQRLKTKLDTATDEMVSYRDQARDLRNKLRIAEENIKAMQKDAAKAVARGISEREKRELQRVMTERPMPGNGGSLAQEFPRNGLASHL